VQLAEARSHLFTSNFNLDEAYTLILGRLGYHFAFTFLTQLTSSPTTVIRVTEGDEARAQEILKTYDDKRFSYTDATTFALMDRLNIP
jgi:predicted nucleic acid-binding protein